MKKKIIDNVVCTMQAVLDSNQLEILKLVLEKSIEDCIVSKKMNRCWIMISSYKCLWMQRE